MNTQNLEYNNNTINVSSSTETPNFEEILNSLKCAALIMNYSTTITFDYANDYFYELMGFTKEEYQTQFNNNVTARIYPDDIQRLRATVSRQLSMGGDIRYEFRIIRKDGSIAWVLLNGKKCHSNSLKIYASFVDISEMKDLYNTVAEKNLELDTIYNNTLGGIIKLSSTDLRVTSANNGFYKLIGYTKEEFLHKFNNSLSDLVHHKDLEHLIAFTNSSAHTDNLTIRVLNKAGDTCWFYINASRIGSVDNSPLYLCSITDITDNKTYEKNLEHDQKKRQLLAQMSGEVVWEYDCTKHVFTKGTDQTGYLSNKGMKENYRNGLINFKYIHPDDINIYNKYCDDLESGQKQVEMDIRVLNRETNDYSWYRSIGKTLFDKNNKPTTIIGKTYNNDDTHDAINALAVKVTRDPLTQLYNRSAIETSIQEKLTNKQVIMPYAFILIDIDNFRAINDSLGHLYGDSILQELGKIMVKVCPTDKIGRVGTDVYAIFLEDVNSKEFIDTLIENITFEINKLYSDELTNHNVTCSFGICYSTKSEPNFEVLFRKADIALFTAKASGKNTHVYFSEELEYNHSNYCTLNEYNMQEGFSLLQASIDTALITSAIDLLFDSKDTLNAVKILLSKIKEHFDCEYVSFISFKENRNGNYNIKSMSVPSSYRIQTKTISKELYAEHQSMFNHDHLFYCSDISSLTNINSEVYDFLHNINSKSVLQSGNFIHGKYNGYLSLGNCTTKKTWTSNQVRTFSILSKIVFTAVGKMPIK